MPSNWTWAAKEGSTQFEYNHKRMQFLVEHELETVIKHWENCKSTGIQVDMDQIESAYCCDCVVDKSCRNEKTTTDKADEWTSVRPSTLDYRALPRLSAGDKAVLTLSHPVITIREHYMVNAKLRQESTTLITNQM